jgi:acylphosphatase
MTVCKRVTYSGRVQGVGFRFTAQHLAAGYRVDGHVRNLPDGDVEVVAEGEADEVERFLTAVAARMAPNIERSSAHDEPSAGRRGFHIRH